MDKKLIIRLVGAVVGIVAGTLVATMTPPEGLTPEAVRGLGIFIGAVIFWITGVFPDHVTAVGMSMLWVLFKAVPFGTAFGGFRTTTTWLIMGALCMALAITKSGLLSRIALMMMLKFPLTFRGQTLGLMLTTVVVSPFIPNGNTKGALLAPLATSVSEAMGYERQSKGAVGLVGAVMYTVVGVVATFMSGTFATYLLIGLFPAEYTAGINWGTWFLYAIPWTIVVLVLGYIAIQFFYGPKGETKGFSKEKLIERKKAMGNMSRDEKYSLVVFICALLLWITESLHGIDATMVVLGAVFALFVLKVIDVPSFRSGVPWEAVTLMGCILNTTVVFPALKLDKWIGSVMEPFLLPLIGMGPIAFLLVLVLFYIFIRVFVVSMATTFSMITLFLVPHAMGMGMSAFIIAFVGIAAANTWILRYQNATYLLVEAASSVGNNTPMVKHSQLLKLAVAYLIIIMIAVIVSVPYWKLLGLIQ